MEKQNNVFEEDEIFSKDEYKLVVTIVKRGFETDVLEAAKSIGSNGAILMQAKGVSKIQEKFFGFSLNPENTTIMILVKTHIGKRVRTLLILVACAVSLNAQTYPFQNPGLSPKERAEDLCSRLTLEEKAMLMSKKPKKKAI